MPTPLRFTADTKCIGTDYWINGDLGCTFSTDMKTATMTIKVSAGSRRVLAESFLQNTRRSLREIPGGNLIALNITNIVSPFSLKPSSGSIAFKALTASGALIEEQTTGFVITNSKAGALNVSQSELVPSYFEKDAFANYTLTFVPINYEINM